MTTLESLSRNVSSACIFLEKETQFLLIKLFNICLTHLLSRAFFVFHLSAGISTCLLRIRTAYRSLQLQNNWRHFKCPACKTNRKKSFFIPVAVCLFNHAKWRYIYTQYIYIPIIYIYIYIYPLYIYIYIFVSHNHIFYTCYTQCPSEWQCNCPYRDYKNCIVTYYYTSAVTFKNTT